MDRLALQGLLVGLAPVLMAALEQAVTTALTPGGVGRCAIRIRRTGSCRVGQMRAIDSAGMVVPPDLADLPDALPLDMGLRALQAVTLALRLGVPLYLPLVGKEGAG
jgi:hypothetical protein